MMKMKELGINELNKAFRRQLGVAIRGNRPIHPSEFILDYTGALESHGHRQSE